MSAGRDHNQATLLNIGKKRFMQAVPYMSVPAEAVHGQTIQHILAKYKQTGWDLNALVVARKGAYWRI